MKSTAEGPVSAGSDGQPIAREREAAREALYVDLVRETGPLLDSESLRRALRFETAAAFRRAFERGQLGVRTFSLPHRRGRFALARDVANWIVGEVYGPSTEVVKIND